MYVCVSLTLLRENTSKHLTTNTKIYHAFTKKVNFRLILDFRLTFLSHAVIC